MANIKNKYSSPLSTEFTPKDLVVDIKNGHLYYKSNLGVHKLVGDEKVKDIQGIMLTSSGSSTDEGGHLTLLPPLEGGYIWNVDNYQENFRIFTQGTATAVRMQISSSGYVGMGTTTPDQLLHINNASSPQILIEKSVTGFVRLGVSETAGVMCLGWDHEDDIHFGVYDSPTDTTLDAKMTIEGATGHVGIGITNPTSRLHVVDNSGTFGAEVPVVKFQNTSTDNYASVMELHIGDASYPYSSANMEFIGFHNGAGVSIGRIHGNTFGEDGINIDDTPSDRRLKHDIKESTRLGIDKLMQLRMVDFRYIKAPEKVHTSIIAQECKEVYPDAISDYEQENKEKGLVWGDDGYQPMYVQSNKFIPLLLTAVQDQQKIIEKLEARIEKIENK